MLQASKINKNILSDAYIICNTPRSLYSTFRSNSIVQDIANSNSTKEIIETFLKIGEEGIDSIEDLAYAYALYIALTFKEYDEVYEFYNDKGNINFEWFPDVKNIYIFSYKYTNQYTLPADSFNVKEIYTIDKYDLVENKKWDNHEIIF